MRYRTILRFIGAGTGVDTLGRPLQTREHMRDVPVGEMLLLATDDHRAAERAWQQWYAETERMLSPGQRAIVEGMRATMAAFEPIRVFPAIVADTETNH